MRAAILFVAGLAAGIGLVVACDRNGVGIDGGRPADAAPSDCAVWQVANLRGHPVDTIGTPSDLPAGWEPFSAFGGAPGHGELLRAALPPLTPPGALSR